MTRNVFAVVAVAGTLFAVTPGVWAQAAPASEANSAATNVDPAAVQALQKMGSYLQSLKRFSVSIDLTGERVLDDGEKLQHTAMATLFVERPDRIRALMVSSRSEREIIYNGKTAVLYSPQQKFYSSVAFDGNLSALIEQLRVRYAVEFPLADLFIWGTADAPTDQFESAMFAGQDFVGRDICDHYAFRQKGVDWQIWITTGEKPLPRKLVITRRDDEARPQSISIVEWTTSPAFKDSVFTFQSPKGAKKIELVPVAGKKE
ncbi:DUF2092 domain-containing protein [Paraburkholderia sp. BL21I4N1]|uniref:DUF2092 domain-containing protein n=1 Tax=Paraburkholderia sp. BL21I4N1 TaxID=1938801 RepID=UPI000CFD5DF2|nr:DUF2092 domain-containing protein [Paraburkholderia sp. BL21I4N1]PQV49172.1 hypothetical protein B0G83_107117 [Paraburkholderia sp. BL21I4N1]